MKKETVEMKVRNLRVELRRNRGLKTAPRSQLDRGHPKRHGGRRNSERQNVERADDSGKCQRQEDSVKIRKGTSQS